MSNVAEQFDLKGQTIQWLNQLSAMYVKDIKALPNDQLTVSPGGCARTPQEITGEVIGLCKLTIAFLRGQEMPTATEDENRASLSALTTSDQLAAVVEATTKEFCEAIAAAPDDIWSKEIIPPWQMPTTIWALTNIAVNHFWYHDGQINTYQCLLGDDKIHWMD